MKLTFFFTGDYKIEVAPVSGKPTDFKALASIGERGVDFLLADSTNAEPAMMWNGGASAGDCLTENRSTSYLQRKSVSPVDESL